MENQVVPVQQEMTFNGRFSMNRENVGQDSQEHIAEDDTMQDNSQREKPKGIVQSTDRKATLHQPQDKSNKQTRIVSIEQSVEEATSIPVVRKSEERTNTKKSLEEGETRQVEFASEAISKGIREPSKYNHSDTNRTDKGKRTGVSNDMKNYLDDTERNVKTFEMERKKQESPQVNLPGSFQTLIQQEFRKRNKFPDERTHLGNKSNLDAKRHGKGRGVTIGHRAKERGTNGGHEGLGTAGPLSSDRFHGITTSNSIKDNTGTMTHHNNEGSEFKSSTIKLYANGTESETNAQSSRNQESSSILDRNDVGSAVKAQSSRNQGSSLNLDRNDVGSAVKHGKSTFTTTAVVHHQSEAIGDSSQEQSDARRRRSSSHGPFLPDHPYEEVGSLRSQANDKMLQKVTNLVWSSKSEGSSSDFDHDADNVKLLGHSPIAQSYSSRSSPGKRAPPKPPRRSQPAGSVRGGRSLYLRLLRKTEANRSAKTGEDNGSFSPSGDDELSMEELRQRLRKDLLMFNIGLHNKVKKSKFGPFRVSLKNTKRKDARGGWLNRRPYQVGVFDGKVYKISGKAAGNHTGETLSKEQWDGGSTNHDNLQGPSSTTGSMYRYSPTWNHRGSPSRTSGTKLQKIHSKGRNHISATDEVDPREMDIRIVVTDTLGIVNEVQRNVSTQTFRKDFPSRGSHKGKYLGNPQKSNLIPTRQVQIALENILQVRKYYEKSTSKCKSTQTVNIGLKVRNRPTSWPMSKLHTFQRVIDGNLYTLSRRLPEENIESMLTEFFQSGPELPTFLEPTESEGTESSSVVPSPQDVQIFDGKDQLTSSSCEY